MPPLNIGIVGLGKMGILHAGIVNALSDGKVAAICEREGMLVKAAKKVLPKIPFYEDIGKMVEEEVLDGIFITSPIHTHAPIIETALKSKSSLGIFAEKPLAASGDEAGRIAEMAIKRGVANMVGFQKRFSPIFQHARMLLEKGAIGDLQFFKSYNFVSDIFRQGEGWRFKEGSGGALLDLGPHLIDLLTWYLGDLKPVSAVSRSLYSREVEDYLHSTMETGSGALGTFEVCWSIRGYRLPEILLEMHGTNGSLTVTDDYVRVQADKAIEGVVSAGSQLMQKTAFNTSVEFLLADPEFTIEDQHFLETVRRRGSAQPDFLTAAKVNRMIDTIHLKVENG